jgi:type II secretory ATPase GspE/PulE/Tfp pilus assembly ATPase PilB-like protein
MDMGIEPFLINASLSGVIAQRLVRRLCEHCKVGSIPSAQDQVLMQEFSISCTKLFKPVGCDQCKRIGFSGRIGIFELLELDENLRNLIIKHPRLTDIYQQGIACGMVPLKADAIHKLEQGITSLEEILRVIR